MNKEDCLGLLCFTSMLFAVLCAMLYLATLLRVLGLFTLLFLVLMIVINYLFDKEYYGNK